MNLTGEQELLIRRKVAEKIDAIDIDWFVVPSPIAFTDKADFWNVLNPKLTQKEIERTFINAVWISYLRFEDDIDDGCGEENPVTVLYYRLHIFCEYGFSRVDEPDDFLKRVLVREREFMNFVFAVRQEFLGETDLDDLPDEIEYAKTQNLEQTDFADDRADTEYVGGVEGFTADMTLQVRAMSKE